ncbi:PQQ-binding-like beta-propeller repeat protein, partial [Streptomyces sp. PRKS01-29]|nr:PQQ-binding-like beta-propeller repeat protein [Streptomyces sabulosicollis]
MPGSPPWRPPTARPNPRGARFRTARCCRCRACCGCAEGRFRSGRCVRWERPWPRCWRRSTRRASATRGSRRGPCSRRVTGHGREVSARFGQRGPTGGVEWGLPGCPPTPCHRSRRRAGAHGRGGRLRAGAPARAAVAGGRLVIHGSDGGVAALDTRTGRTAWGPREQGSPTALAPAVADGVVYLGGKSPRALALASGEEKWAHAGQGGTGWTAPAVRKRVVYAVDGTDLSARRAGDGAAMWTLPFASDDPPLDAPVAEGGSLWAALGGRGDQGVAAVDVRGGSVAWPYVPGTEGGWWLAAAGNRVFALQSGTLTAMPVFQPAPTCLPA